MKVYYHDKSDKEKIEKVEYFDNIDGITVQFGNFNKEDYPLHTHDFDELAIITKGTGTHIINNQSYTITTGDVFILKGNDIHSYAGTENMQLYNIAYTQDKLSILGSDIKRLPGYHALFMFEPIYRKIDTFESKLHLTATQLLKVSELLSALRAEYESNQPGSSSMVTALFSQLVVYLSRTYSDIAVKSDHSFMTIAKAVSHIESSFTQDLKLNELADIANLSVSHFCRIFNEVYNISPINYIIQLRIKKACHLLKENRQNITEIALQCGFYNSNYFARVFRKVKGVSPREYMKNLSGHKEPHV